MHQEDELSDGKMADLMGFVNTIITHITNGNQNEERLVGIMGGKIIETQTEIWMKQGKAQMTVEIGQEDGLDDARILERLQGKWTYPLKKTKFIWQNTESSGRLQIHT